MQPKEGFGRKIRGGGVMPGSKGPKGAGLHFPTTYSKLNKDKKNQLSQQQASLTARNLKNNKGNIYSTSNNPGQRKDPSASISYNPKMALKDQIKLIDEKLNTQGNEPAYLRHPGSKNSTSNPNIRNFFSNPRHRKGSNSSRFASTSQRRILSLDRASSFGSNQGILPIRDSSLQKQYQDTK